MAMRLECDGCGAVLESYLVNDIPRDGGKITSVGTGVPDQHICGDCRAAVGEFLRARREERVGSHVPS